MKPQIRFETTKSMLELSKAFDIPYSETMQDWPYEVADTASIEKYLNYYQSILDDDVKFTLMQMMIQAIEEQETLKAMEFYWEKAKPLLIQDFKIHEWTIYYWSLKDGQIKSDWRISPYMATLWQCKMI